MYLEACAFWLLSSIHNNMTQGISIAFHWAALYWAEMWRAFHDQTQEHNMEECKDRISSLSLHCVLCCNEVQRQHKPLRHTHCILGLRWWALLGEKRVNKVWPSLEACACACVSELVGSQYPLILTLPAINCGSRIASALAVTVESGLSVYLCMRGCAISWAREIVQCLRCTGENRVICPQHMHRGSWM